MPRKKKCPWKDKCQNGDEGCWTTEPKNCVRFLPTEGTNLTKIDMVVETPPNIDYDKFSQYFMNWIESMGWGFCGSLKKYEETEGDAGTTDPDEWIPVTSGPSPWSGRYDY